MWKYKHVPAASKAICV